MITINRKEFSEGITLGSSMAGKSKVLPILDLIRCEINGNELTMMSYDTETAVKNTINVKENNYGNITFAIPPREIISILKSIEDEDVFLDVKDDTIELKYKKGTLSIPRTQADDFPVPTEEEKKNEILVNSEELFNALNEAIAFCETKGIRKALGGVLISAKEEKLYIVATDSVKLYENIINCSYNGEEINGIIPSKGITTIMQTATNGAEFTTINIGTINATITNNKAQVCTRLIEAKYPNYKAIIPQSFNFNVDFDKNDITNSIKRVMIATEQSDKRIKIEFNNMYANISVNNNTQRKKAQETCQYITTEQQQIPTMVVNGNYIQDGLNCIKTNNVSILINDDKKPFVMKENNNDNNSNKTILIMPCVHN